MFPGYNEATTWKAGVQWTGLGVEAEGPNAQAGANWDPTRGNAGVFSEAALGRAELQILRGSPVGAVATIETNLNTGIGMRDGKGIAGCVDNCWLGSGCGDFSLMCW